MLIAVFVDSDHVCDGITRRSISWILIFAERTEIIFIEERPSKLRLRRTERSRFLWILTTLAMGLRGDLFLDFLFSPNDLKLYLLIRDEVNWYFNVQSGVLCYSNAHRTDIFCSIFVARSCSIKVTRASFLRGKRKWFVQNTTISVSLLKKHHVDVSRQKSRGAADFGTFRLKKREIDSFSEVLATSRTLKAFCKLVIKFMFA